MRPDFARAADLGVTATAIGETLRVATAGDYDQSLPKLNLAQRQVPIVVKLPDDARTDLGLLGAPGGAGRARPGDAGQRRDARRSKAARRMIDRYDRSRNVNFEIELSGSRSATCKDEALALPCHAATCRPACA